MKTLIKALLGASMLMPVAAQAQRGGLDVDAAATAQDDGPRDRQRNADQRAPQQRPDRGAPDDGQADSAVGEIGTQAGGSDDTGRGRRFQRDPGEDRPEVRPERDDRAYRQQRQDQRAGVAAGTTMPDRNRDRGERPDGTAFRADGREAGRNIRPDRRDDRQQARTQPERPSWNGNRGGNTGGYASSGGALASSGYDRGRDDHARDDRRGGGNWNRQWHTDSRYDWNRYRAANRGAYRLPRYYAPYGSGYGYRRFSVGITLSSLLWGRDYWIDDPYSYRLPEAYGPYRWVRYYDDALLVDIRNGRVIDTVYGIFW